MTIKQYKQAIFYHLMASLFQQTVIKKNVLETQDLNTHIQINAIQHIFTHTCLQNTRMLFNPLQKYHSPYELRHK